MGGANRGVPGTTGHVARSGGPSVSSLHWAVWKICSLAGVFGVIFGCVKLSAAYNIGTEGRLALLIATLMFYVLVVTYVSPRIMRRHG